MSKGTRIPLADAEQIADAFCKTYLLDGKYEICGSIRRKSPDVGDIDLMTSLHLEAVRARFDKEVKLLDGGEARMNISFKGIVFNIYYYEIEYQGAMMLFLTGSHGYGIGLRRIAQKKGLKLNQYGIWKEEICLASQSEQEIYKVLGKDWKPPEQRGK